MRWAVLFLTYMSCLVKSALLTCWMSFSAIKERRRPPLPTRAIVLILRTTRKSCISDNYPYKMNRLSGSWTFPCCWPFSGKIQVSPRIGPEVTIGSLGVFSAHYNSFEAFPDNFRQNSLKNLLVYNQNPYKNRYTNLPFSLKGLSEIPRHQN